MLSPGRFFAGSLLGITALVYALGSWAQPTTLTADIAKTKISWIWNQGTGGPVEKWLIRCGSSPGNYTLQVSVQDASIRSLPITQVIPAIGTYYCAVAAQNSTSTSGLSPEVTFTAGKLVDTSAQQTIQTQ